MTGSKGQVQVFTIYDGYYRRYDLKIIDKSTHTHTMNQTSARNIRSLFHVLAIHVCKYTCKVKH